METLADTHTLELLPFVKNLPLGIIGLFSVLWMNVFFLRRITLNYEIQSRISINKNNANGVFRQYFLAIIYLMLVQIFVIVLWGLSLNLLALIKDPLDAIMFAGSCYTTIGIVSEHMPQGWRFIAVIIALSGLFAVALATSSMLNMSVLFRQAWLYKHADKIQAVINREKIVIPDFVSVEETIKVKAEIKTTGSHTT